MLFKLINLWEMFYGIFGKCFTAFLGSQDNQTFIEMGYCDLNRSWSTDVLPYLPFQLEHCPNNAQFCRVEDETTIFDHNLTIAAIHAMRLAAARPDPWFLASVTV